MINVFGESPYNMYQSKKNKDDEISSAAFKKVNTTFQLLYKVLYWGCCNFGSFCTIIAQNDKITENREKTILLFP